MFESARLRKNYAETHKQNALQHRQTQMHTVATLSMRALHLKLAASRQLATCDDMPTARPKANAHSVHEATTKSHRAQKRALRRVECAGHTFGAYVAY